MPIAVRDQYRECHPFDPGSSFSCQRFAEFYSVQFLYLQHKIVFLSVSSKINVLGKVQIVVKLH